MSPSVKFIFSALTWRNGKLNARATINHFTRILLESNDQNSLSIPIPFRFGLAS